MMMMKWNEYDKWLDGVRVVKPNFKLREGKRIVFVIENRVRHEDGYFRIVPELAEGTVTYIFRENFQNTKYQVRLLDGSTMLVRRYQVVEVL